MNLKGGGDDLSKIKAPLGVYSVLGNHDYGEYTSWKSENEKNRNFIDFHLLALLIDNVFFFK